MTSPANPPAPGIPTKNSRRSGPQRLAPAFLLGLGVLGLISSESAAAPITIRYGGTITNATPYSGVNVGDRFSGLITYDPDGRVSASYRGSYGSTTSTEYNSTTYTFVDGWGVPARDGTNASMTLAIGGRQIFSVPDALAVGIARTHYTGYDGTVYDHTTYRFTPNQDETKLEGLQYSVVLGNSTYTAANTLDKLPTQFDLADFPEARLDVYDAANPPIPIPIPPYTTGEYTPNPIRSYSGAIDTFEVVATPEPSTFALFGLGAAGWLIRSRRRRGRAA